MMKRGEYLKYVQMYGFYYFAVAMFSVLISIYMMDKGMSAGQVSLLISASCVISMFIQPFVGVLLDKGSKRWITALILGLASVIGVLFAWSQTFVWMLLSYGIAIALINSVNPYIERMATVSQFSYRSIRIWGTVGYALGAQIAGIVYDGISPASVYYFLQAL